MSRRARAVIGRIGFAAIIAAAVIASTAVDASAAGGGHFTTPAPGTTVTGNLKSGTDMVFKGTIDGVPITVNCTSFTGSGKTPKTGLSIKIAPPAITGCTDTLGGVDTIKTNATNGSWKVTEVLGTTDKAKLVIPKAGATFTSSLVGGCVITAEPAKAASVTGTYDNVNTDTVTNAKIPVTGTGCSATAASVSATVIFTPDVEGAA
jgi:hypothetical protein